jgi:Ca2+-binding RTX toxin-like protein
MQRQNHRHGRRPLRMESLERREVLTALPTVTLVEGLGELSIQGTDFNDHVEVALNAATNQLEVYAYPQNLPPGSAVIPQVFDASKVTWIGFYGGKGNDVFVNHTGLLANADGGDGNDTLVGGSGLDILYGGKGNDWLFGGDGNDYLEGEEGSDVLFGENGNDWLIGDADKAVDWLIGGAGADVFFLPLGHFTGAEPEAVLDFTMGQDLAIPY